MLKITNKITIPSTEIQTHAIRAQGPGGQNVNKTSTAIHLKYDIKNSSLPDNYKTKLLNQNDYRITKQGIITIKAQRYRSQDMNLKDAHNRLRDIIEKAIETQKPRKPTKPTKASKEKRLKQKAQKSQQKTLRKKVY